MDRLFHTGYPHPLNIAAALMLTLLPLLSPFTVVGRENLLPPANYGLAGLISVTFLLVWSRIRVLNPDRSPRFYMLYGLAQTAVVSLIYFLDGGLTRFLFVLVLAQIVYISPVRLWLPFLGSLAALWLSLYLFIAPSASVDSRVTTIGMYFLYLLFAAFVTFTTVQQERQNQVAQQLLADVNQRHQTLQAWDKTIAHRTETEERGRLAQTIATTLMLKLSALRAELERLRTGAIPLTQQTGRNARLQAKDVLGAIRQAVRTLRPGEDGELQEDEARPLTPPEPEINVRWTDPVRLYHVWNIGVILITAGVMVASLLVAGRSQWRLFIGAASALLAAYGMASLARRPWSRTLALVTQSGLIMWSVAISREPLMCHLFLIVAAQTVFMVPPVGQWLVAAVLFPSGLSLLALWLTGLYTQNFSLLLTLTLAFSVTNFFAAVMAFMTRRQVGARNRAVTYAQQLTEVNRLLSARLEEVRRMAIARERVRMAREIHDGLGHHLTIVIMELQYVEALAEEDPAAAVEHIEAAQRVIDKALAASQELSVTLERFDRPLDESLKELVTAWRKGNGARVRLSLKGELSVLSTAVRITLYRAVQESLTNIQKHALASWVEISVRRVEDQVYLTVANDDQGKPPEADLGVGGFGLLGLRERAEALHGHLSAGPRPQGGFQVHLVLPLGV